MGKQIEDPVDAIITLFSAILDGASLFLVPGIVIAALFSAFLFITASGNTYRILLAKRIVLFSCFVGAAIFLARAILSSFKGTS